ncbi:DUF2795 domain-containing protein [Halobaculum sp. MBLA0147]|uniref:DUF5789 family protein n=1 Tax=Halobaculum sp. MBLA0147 TaxID=3079934 RepID=UPI003526362B
MRIEDTAAELRTHEFPITRDDILAEHGDVTVELADGSDTVTDVLERAGGEEYATYEDLRAALLCGLPAGAVGRRGYSDRDAPAVGEEGPTPVSF